jgi:hypothetical protein
VHASTQWDAAAVAVSASSKNLVFTILSVEDKEGIFGCERNRVIQRDIKAKQKRERQQTLPCVSEAFSSGCVGYWGFLMFCDFSVLRFLTVRLLEVLDSLFPVVCVSPSFGN